MITPSTPRIDTLDTTISRENLLLNGEGLVSQRGAYTTATACTSGQYNVDQWKNYVVGVTATVQRVLTSLPDGMQSSVKYAATSSASGVMGVYQPIEVYAYLLNQTVTLSAYVKSNSANARLRLYLGASSVYSTPHTGDGTWQRLSVTTTVVSISALEPLIAIMSGSAGSVSITSGDYIQHTGVKLEVNNQASLYVPRPYDEEYLKCLRYYRRISAYSDGGGPKVAWAGIRISSNRSVCLLAPSSPMRIDDAVVSYSDLAHFTAQDSVGSTTPTQLTLDRPKLTEGVGSLNVYYTAAALSGTSVWLSFNNALGWFALSAEL